MSDIQDQQDVVVEVTSEIGNPPEGYTRDEWERMTAADREGILDMIANPDGDSDITLEDLKEISETEEEKKAREEKEAADKQLELDKKEAEEKGITVEEVVAARTTTTETTTTEADTPNTNTKPTVVSGDLVSDEDLLSFRPHISSADLKVELTIPSDVKTKYENDLKELRDQFDKDEISSSEYETRRDIIKDAFNDWKLEERDRLKEDRRAQVTWEKEEQAFYAARPEYIGDKQPDNTYKKTPKSAALLGALNAAVQQIEEETPGLPGMQLLIKADRIVRETFGLPTTGGKKTTSTPKKEETTKTAAQVAKEKPEPTPADTTNLGDIVSDKDNSVGDKFDIVDKMSPRKREEWLAKQSPAVVDAYLAGANRGV